LIFRAPHVPLARNGPVFFIFTTGCLPATNVCRIAIETRIGFQFSMKHREWQIFEALGILKINVV